MRNKGFTVMEVSMVIVIAGLVLGGVVVGKNVVRSAELQGIQKEAQFYANAVGQFKQKYNGMPGDLLNGTSIFTSSANGNGNGRIDWSSESMQAWLQLGQSQLIQGSYTGTGTTATPGTNVPVSRYQNKGVIIFYDSTTRSNMLETVSSGGTPNNGGLISAEDAAVIDLKYDDGNPLTGNIRGAGASCAVGSLTTGSATGTNSTSLGSYVTSSSSISCSPQFILPL